MTTARLARPDEAGLVETITQDAYAIYERTLGFKPLPMTEAYAPRIAAGQVWLVEADVMAGAMVLETHPDHLMLYSLALRPAYQGQGIGRWMLQFAEDEALRRGVPQIRLYTNARMERNIALYVKAGFAEVGRRPHPNPDAGMFVDMVKRVRDEGPGQTERKPGLL